MNSRKISSRKNKLIEVKGPISWMARNSVPANLLMIVFIVGGIGMSYRIKKEVFPLIELDRISITVPYPGASPAEVEQGILLAIEEAVRPIDNVKEVESVARESMGMVDVELEVGSDRNKALTDVKNAVDRIVTFPEEAERPIVNLPEWRAEAINLVIYGDLKEKVLFSLVKGKDDEIDNLFAEIFNEHKEIKQFVVKLKQDDDVENTMDKLGHLLESHIRKEERVLFEKIQDILNENELAILKNQLSKSRDTHK